jgi:general secretion pathway protein D
MPIRNKLSVVARYKNKKAVLPWSARDSVVESGQMLKVDRRMKKKWVQGVAIGISLGLLGVVTPSLARAQQTPPESGARSRANLQRTGSPPQLSTRGTGTPSGTPPATATPARTAPALEQGRDGFASVPQSQPIDTSLDYKPPKKGERFTFNLVDADLIELVKIIGNITGKSFILGGKAPTIKATIYAPTKITAEEAYRAFLSVLQVNGLTVIPSGKYLKILPTAGATGENTPIVTAVPGRDQIVTRLHQFDNVAAADIVPTLERFKSKEGDIAVYAPTNTVIITDYGTSIQRLTKLISLLDVPGTTPQIWVEPIHYADATDVATRITEIYEALTNGGGSTQTPARRGGGGTARGSGATGTGARPPGGRGAQQQPAGSAPPGDIVDVGSLARILADARTNALIIIGSESAYLRIMELVKVLDVPMEGEGTMYVHKLQHTDAEELAKTLNTLSKGATTAARSTQNKGTEMFEGQLSISADKATNSLVIVATMRDYAALKSVIDKLDTVQRQVFVEAVIMEVSLEKTRQLGFSLHGGTMVGTGDRQSLVYGLSAPPGGPNSLVLDPTSLTGLAAGVRGPEIEGSEGMVGFSVPAFGVALQALQQNTDVNVLSSPHILATDNVEAIITVGENVPVLQGVNSGAQLLSALAGGSTSSLANNLLGGSGLTGMMSSYTRQDVGISLKIKPHINDDNQVRIEVDMEISNVKSVDPTQGPTISKESAKTTSVVADQQTFVLGGLITDNQVETTNKVPFLGDIPLIGALFRHKASITKKRNLIIFLTPYIIRNADDFREIYERKMAERREFIERYTAFMHHRYDPHIEWSRTQGAITVIDKVIGTAEEDARLRRMASDPRERAHYPKAPLNFSRQGGVTLEGDEVADIAPGDIVIEATPADAGASTALETAEEDL